MLAQALKQVVELRALHDLTVDGDVRFTLMSKGIKKALIQLPVIRHGKHCLAIIAALYLQNDVCRPCWAWTCCCCHVADQPHTCLWGLRWAKGGQEKGDGNIGRPREDCGGQSAQSSQVTSQQTYTASSVCLMDSNDSRVISDHSTYLQSLLAIQKTTTPKPMGVLS